MHTLTRLEFARGKQRVVLQGMVHLAKKRLYQNLQIEIYALTSDGYQMFAEGLASHKPGQVFTPAQQQIFDLFSSLLNINRENAKRVLKVTEEQGIKYPKDVIRADIDYAEMVLEMRKHDVFVSDELLGLIRNPRYRELMADQTLAPKEFEKFEQKAASLNAVKMLTRARHVLIDYRNQVLVDHVESYMAQHREGKALIHYGQKHVPGVCALLEKRGWQLVSESVIEID